MTLGLGDLIAAGSRAVGRYTGTLLAVFVVQSLVALACMMAIAGVLARTFAHLPMWDEAVDGDLVALVFCLRYGDTTFVASSAIVLGAVLVWQLASWFVAGGIYGVLAQRPEGRGETARCFGAGGAATYLSYARLALCALPAWLVVFVLFRVGHSLVESRIEHALTLPQLLVPLALAALPAVVLAHVVWTATDCARVELTLRQASHDPGVVATFLRALAYVVRRPLVLVHTGLGWLAFLAISAGYMYLAQGHPMYGAEGAVTLFVIRQGVALARAAIRFGVLAGQVELGNHRPLPPRRVETKSDTKKS